MQAGRRRPAAIVAVLVAVDRPLAFLSIAGFISQVGVAVMLPLLPLCARQVGAPTAIAIPALLTLPSRLR